jgi:hypothetical protein
MLAFEIKDGTLLGARFYYDVSSIDCLYRHGLPCHPVKHYLRPRHDTFTLECSGWNDQAEDLCSAVRNTALQISLTWLPYHNPLIIATIAR